MSMLRINLFGHPSAVTGKGEPVKFRSVKHLATLVYLVLEGQRRPISRARLAGLLWPTAGSREALHSLSQALSVLRGLLGPHSITRGAQPVRLLAAPKTDLDDLRSGIYPTHGLGDDPLADFDGLAGMDWAHWVDQARAHCREAARRALGSQLTQYKLKGELRAVSECATALYQVDPLSEPAICALAEQQMLDGKREEALEFLRIATARFVEVTGLESVRLVELWNRANEYVTPAGEHTDLANDRQDTTRKLIGRTEQLTEVESTWQEVCQGQVRTALVQGLPGIGKSAFIAEVERRTRQRGWLVIRTKCERIESNIPFASVSDLVTTLAHHSGVGGVDPAWLADASRVASIIRLRYPGVPSPTSCPPGAIQIRIAEALAQMIKAAADQQPCLLVLDDAHRIDPTSGSIIHLVKRRLHNVSLMVLAAAQPTAFGTPTDLRRNAFINAFEWDRVIKLRALEDHESAEFVRSLNPEEAVLEPSDLRAIVANGDGNPCLLEALASDFGRKNLAHAHSTTRPGAVPDTKLSATHDAVAQLLTQLSADAELVLATVGVIGTKCDSGAIAETCGLSQEKVDLAIRQLLAFQILVTSGNELTIRNKLHEDYTRTSIDPDLRRFLNGRAATVATRHRTEPQFMSDMRRGLYLNRSGRVSGAATELIAAAAKATESGAPIEAEQALKTLSGAGEPPLSSDLHLMLAQSLLAQGKSDEALQSVQDALSSGNLSREQQRLALVVRAESAVRSSATSRGDVVSAVEAAREAVGGASAWLRWRALQVAVEIASEQGNRRALGELEKDSEDLLADSSSEDLRALGQVTNAFVLMNRGKHRLGASLLESSLQFFSRVGWDPERRRCLNGIGIALTARGKYAAAITAFREAIAIARGSRDNFGEMLGWANLGVCLCDIGEYGDSISAFEEARLLYLKQPSRRQGTELYASIIEAHIIAGRVDLAEQQMNDLALAAAAAGSDGSRLSMVLASIELLLAQQSRSEARLLATSELPVRLDTLPTTVSAPRVRAVQLDLGLVEASVVSLRRDLEGSRNFASRELEELECLALCADLNETASEGSQTRKRLEEMGATGIIGSLHALRTTI